MNAKASTIAQKLINLYRQEHVIIGGWAAVNQVFVNDASDDVLRELAELPTGKDLVRHIDNLRTGRTPMNGINHELLPYGGMMTQKMPTIRLTTQQIHELESELNTFTPTQSGLDKIRALDVVKKFADEWLDGIHAALAIKPELQKKWETVRQTVIAYELWNSANQILNEPISNRTRAK